MKQMFLILIFVMLLLCGTSISAKASPIKANSSNYIELARSFKLTEIPSKVFGNTNQSNAGVIDKCADDAIGCEEIKGCSSASDCNYNQTCSDDKICRNLCRAGLLPNGSKCSNIKEPECEIELSGHVAYCACTVSDSGLGDSCGEAYECKKSGVQYKCIPCVKGENCRCPFGQKSNGRGLCVSCNSNTDCLSKQVCNNAGTSSALCQTLMCSNSQYVDNHQCKACSTVIPNCVNCISASQCLVCSEGYALKEGRCTRMQTCGQMGLSTSCGSGYNYLFMKRDDYGNSCYSCSLSKKTCRQMGYKEQNDSCSSGYKLESVQVLDDWNINCYRCVRSDFTTSQPEQSCPNGFSTSITSCKPGWKWDYVTVGDKKCGKCTVCDYGWSSCNCPGVSDGKGGCMKCSAGYNYGIKSCGNGLIYDHDGSGCGRCSCPSGYSIGISSCPGGKAYDYKSSQGVSCGKCTNCGYGWSCNCGTGRMADGKGGCIAKK